MTEPFARGTHAAGLLLGAEPLVELDIARCVATLDQERRARNAQAKKNAYAEDDEESHHA